jgi:hypothetical protein
LGEKARDYYQENERGRTLLDVPSPDTIQSMNLGNRGRVEIIEQGRGNDQSKSLRMPSTPAAPGNKSIHETHIAISEGSR